VIEGINHVLTLIQYFASPREYDKSPREGIELDYDARCGL